MVIVQRDNGNSQSSTESPLVSDRCTSIGIIGTNWAIVADTWQWSGSNEMSVDGIVQLAPFCCRWPVIIARYWLAGRPCRCKGQEQ